MVSNDVKISMIIIKYKIKKTVDKILNLLLVVPDAFISLI